MTTIEKIQDRKKVKRKRTHRSECVITETQQTSRETRIRNCSATTTRTTEKN